MSQTIRILAALQRGPVSPLDFAGPRVIDGGPPVMRVAARIQDLRDQGHEIATTTASNGTAIYTLSAPSVKAGSLEPGNPLKAPAQLFTQGSAAAPRPGMFDEEAA